jgi:hypothetical protein
VTGRGYKEIVSEGSFCNFLNDRATTSALGY